MIGVSAFGAEREKSEQIETADSAYKRPYVSRRSSKAAPVGAAKAAPARSVLDRGCECSSESSRSIRKWRRIRDNPAEDLDVSSKPNLLLLFYPCVDLTLEVEMQYSSEVIGANGYEVSPLFHIPRDLPPLIILQGTADPLYASVTQFCDDAVSLGNRCEFVEYAGAGHGFLNQRSTEEVTWADATVNGMERFLREAAYLGEK